MKQPSKNPKNILNILSWVLCAFFCLCIFSDSILTKLCMAACAVLVCPLFRQKVRISPKVWIPAILVLFYIGGTLGSASPAEAPDASGLISSQSSGELIAEETSSSTPPESQIVSNGSSAVTPESKTTPEVSSTADPESEAPPEVSDTADPESEAPPEVSDTADPESKAPPEVSDTTDPESEAPPEASISKPETNQTADVGDNSSKDNSNNSGTSSGGNTGNSSDSDSSDVIVYITESGGKYHRSTCRYLKKSKIKTTLAKAKKQGYEPCKVCDPPT